MIKVQTFPLDKCGEANAFLEKHSPRSTEKQSGMFFHNNYIGIIYDDGKENPDDIRSSLRLRLEGERQALAVREHELECSKIELPEAKKDLEKIAIEGYLPTWSNGQLKEALDKAKKSTKYVSAKELDTVRGALNSAHARVESLEGMVLTNEFEIRRLGYSISAYEKMMKTK